MRKTIPVVLSAVVVVAMAILAACLQTDPAPRAVAPEQSKIQIAKVPGLESRSVVYEYYGWRPAYQGVEQYYAAGPPTTEEYYAASGRAYPRLEVRVYVVAPGWEWDRDLVIDQGYLKGYPFIRDQAISIGARRLDQTPSLAVVPFQLSGANCFAFIARDVPLVHAAGQKLQQVSADGYYCAAAGAAVDDATAAAVLSNVLVTDNLSHQRVPVWQAAH